MSAPDELLFVYNADSGVINAIRDVWHRVARPSTYPCQLCKVTYGATGMRQDWQDFVADLDLPVLFLHRDEFRHAYGVGAVPGLELPIALLDRGGTLTEVVSAARMRTVTSVDELKALVTDGLDAQGS